jgi:hypothetical protein
VHPCPDPVRLAPKGERVVEVLRGVGIDRDRGQVAQVGAALAAVAWKLVRLELRARPVLGEQRLENVLDPSSAAERPFDPGAPAALRNEREVAIVDIVEALRIEDDRDTRREVRLADDELPAAPDLDDQAVRGAQTRRKRRTVSPEPSMPRPRPIPSRIMAV